MISYFDCFKRRCWSVGEVDGATTNTINHFRRPCPCSTLRVWVVRGLRSYGELNLEPSTGKIDQKCPAWSVIMSSFPFLRRCRHHVPQFILFQKKNNSQLTMRVKEREEKCLRANLTPWDSKAPLKQRQPRQRLFKIIYRLNYLPPSPSWSGSQVC